MNSVKKGIRSIWRESEFWFIIFRNAVVPNIAIDKAIANWPEIRKRLMESSRKR